MAKPVPSEKKPMTVWLLAEHHNNHNRTKMFHCINCRSPVAQYRGQAVSLLPGLHPYEPMALHKCKGTFRNENERWEECGYYYVFASTVFSRREEE